MTDSKSDCESKGVASGGDRRSEGVMIDDIKPEKIRRNTAVEEFIDEEDEVTDMLEEAMLISDPKGMRGVEEGASGAKGDLDPKNLDDEGLFNMIEAEEVNSDDDDLIPSPGPFATQEDIDRYNFEKKKCKVYKKYNMFYVPSYEDTPQLLPHVASIREESPINAVLQKSLTRDSFTYNSWLSRNKYNNSTTNCHIVDDEAVANPGQLYAKPNIHRQVASSRRRASAVPAHRRPSIAMKKVNTVMTRHEYKWIEGSEVKSKEAVDLASFDHAHSKIKAVKLERSPNECDDRVFTFKASLKKSNNNRSGCTNDVDRS
jgi:hypothetical protein